jgi:hypothetical protein
VLPMTPDSLLRSSWNAPDSLLRSSWKPVNWGGRYWHRTLRERGARCMHSRNLISRCFERWWIVAASGFAHRQTKMTRWWARNGGTILPFADCTKCRLIRFGVVEEEEEEEDRATRHGSLHEYFGAMCKRPTAACRLTTHVMIDAFLSSEKEREARFVHIPSWALLTTERTTRHTATSSTKENLQQRTDGACYEIMRRWLVWAMDAPWDRSTVLEAMELCILFELHFVVANGASTLDISVQSHHVIHASRKPSSHSKIWTANKRRSVASYLPQKQKIM